MTLKKSLTLRNILPKYSYGLSPLLFFFQSLPSIHLPFFSSLFLLPLSNCEFEKRSERESRIENGFERNKIQIPKGPPLTPAATTFTTIFIVFLPRPLPRFLALVFSNDKKSHSKKSVHPGPSLKASPSPRDEVTRKRE